MFFFFGTVSNFLEEDIFDNLTEKTLTGGNY